MVKLRLQSLKLIYELLWLIVTDTRILCLFVCLFNGRPRQATDYYSVFVHCTARFGRSNFGHQMPPLLQTRSALQWRKLELMGGEEEPVILPKYQLPRYI
jgi:hypothetical protein